MLDVLYSSHFTNSRRDGIMLKHIEPAWWRRTLQEQTLQDMVVTTTYGGSSDDNVGIMTTVVFSVSENSELAIK